MKRAAPPFARWIGQACKTASGIPQTVYRLVDDGDLQAIRIRGCRRVSLEEIRRFEERLAEEAPF